MNSQTPILNIPPGRVAQRVQTYHNVQELESKRDKLNQLPRKMSKAPDSGIVVGYGRRADSSFGSPARSISRHRYEGIQTADRLPSLPAFHPIHPSSEEKELLRPVSVARKQGMDHSHRFNQTQPMFRNVQELRSRTSSSERHHTVCSFDAAEVLEDVRSRLQTMQAELRETQGDTHVRDGMINELGHMLDNAIATTAPSDTASVSARGYSPLRRDPSASPSKIPLATARLSRAQSVKSKEEKPDLKAKIDNFEAGPTTTDKSPVSPRRLLSPILHPPVFKSIDHFVESPPRSPPNAPELNSAYASPGRKYGSLAEVSRDRRVTESMLDPTPRRELPFGSPVRERTLLWESLTSKPSPENEDDTVSTAPHMIQHYDCKRHFSKTAESSSQDEDIVPPNTRQDYSCEHLIPLALPRLLDAEERRKRNVVVPKKQPTPIPEDEQQLSLEHLTPIHIPDRVASTPWAGNSQFPRYRDSGAPVVQSPETATPETNRDEHYPPARPSLVRNRIRELLSATKEKRPVDGRSSVSSTGEGGAQIHEHILVHSTQDVNTIESKHLPALQISIEERGRVASRDGAMSRPQTPRRSQPGTGYATPLAGSSPRNDQPAKLHSNTPKRGRSRKTKFSQSPGSRPSTFSQHVTLSPCRSDSRNSRGSLTFNIKARVSPTRGNGQGDDAEFSITANVGSDESDLEGSHK